LRTIGDLASLHTTGYLELSLLSAFGQVYGEVTLRAFWRGGLHTIGDLASLHTTGHLELSLLSAGLRVVGDDAALPSCLAACRFGRHRRCQAPDGSPGLHP
jgi:hypothetical protein